MNRRGFLQACLAAAAAPAIVRAGSLMRIASPRLIFPVFSRATTAYIFDAEGLMSALTTYKYNWFKEDSVPAALAAGWKAVDRTHTQYLQGGLQLLQLPLEAKDIYES